MRRCRVCSGMWLRCLRRRNRERLSILIVSLSGSLFVVAVDDEVMIGAS